MSIVASKRPAIAPVLSQFRERRETPFQEAPLRLRVSQLERPSIGGAGLLGAAEPPQQVRSRRMEVVVCVQLQAVDELERLPRAASLADRDRAVELDHRGAGLLGEFAV